jgi:hypothetical protein
MNGSSPSRPKPPSLLRAFCCPKGRIRRVLHSCTMNPNRGSIAPSRHLGRDGLCVSAAQTKMVGVFVGRLPPPTSALSATARSRSGLRCDSRRSHQRADVGAVNRLAEYRHTFLCPRQTPPRTNQQQPTTKTPVFPKIASTGALDRMMRRNGAAASWRPNSPLRRFLSESPMTTHLKDPNHLVLGHSGRGRFINLEPAANGLRKKSCGPG